MCTSSYRLVLDSEALLERLGDGRTKEEAALEVVGLVSAIGGNEAEDWSILLGSFRALRFMLERGFKKEST